MTATASLPGEPGSAARMMRGREREWDTVLRLLKAAEAGRPGVLLVEGEPGTGKSLLLEAALRLEEGDAAGRLFDLMERDGAERRSLGPLDDDAVIEIVIDLLGAIPDPGLVAFAAGAGGNPYLLTELLTGLRDEGAVRISGGRARLSSARPPERVRTGVARRLGGLSPRTRHLLTVSAVLGRSFSPEDVAEILGTTPAAIAPGVEEALESGVVAATPDSLHFRHELIRRVIVEAVPAPVRQALHRQIGELLVGLEAREALSFPPVRRLRPVGFAVL